MSRRDRVLLADDEPLSRDFLQEALEALGCDVTPVADGQEAADAMANDTFDFVVTDLRMPRKDGMAVLAESREADADRPVVLVTAHGAMHVAVEAMRAAAYDFIEKPFAVEDLIDIVSRALDKRALTIENRRLREELAVQGKPGQTRDASVLQLVIDMFTGRYIYQFWVNSRTSRLKTA